MTDEEMSRSPGRSTDRHRRRDRPTAEIEDPWDLVGRRPIFDHDRTEAVLERARRRELPSTSLDELSWTAYESLTTAVNEEIRQLLTTLKHRLQLSLMETDAPRPPLSRGKVWKLVNQIQKGERALDAQISRKEIARTFLSLDPTDCELAETIRDHLQRKGLADVVDASLDPVPAKADPWRFGQAVVVLLEAFLDRGHDEQAVLRLRWRGEQAVLFVGARPAVEPKHRLQRWLDQGVRVRKPGLDIPLARAILECHDAEIVVHETDDGAVGFRCVLPALDDGNPFDR